MLIGNVPDEEQDIIGCQDLVEPVPSTLTFKVPPLGIDPKDFVEKHFGKNSDAKNLQFRKGTTTLAFIYEPETPNDQGASKDVMKILDVGDRMVATMAGGAADCQFWTRIVAKYCALFELREKSEITVAAASKYFSNVLYTYRNSGLMV
ncbi:unnamed protein product, partial [Enterobius vermicularis]|uniref:Proteasome subunit beta type-7 n=1 Tax=Enterobius vermicularis TaxID=51028 RepID=A0A0N4VQ74_ENTVE